MPLFSHKLIKFAGKVFKRVIFMTLLIFQVVSHLRPFLSGDSINIESPLVRKALLPSTMQFALVDITINVISLPF
jgi:acyl dehydratase